MVGQVKLCRSGQSLPCGIALWRKAERHCRDFVIPQRLRVVVTADPCCSPVKGSVLSRRLIFLKYPLLVLSAVGYMYCFAQFLIYWRRSLSVRASSVLYFALLLLKAWNISVSWHDPRGCSRSSANLAAAWVVFKDWHEHYMEFCCHLPSVSQNIFQGVCLISKADMAFREGHLSTTGIQTVEPQSLTEHCVLPSFTHWKLLLPILSQRVIVYILASIKQNNLSFCSFCKGGLIHSTHRDCNDKHNSHLSQFIWLPAIVCYELLPHLLLKFHDFRDCTQLYCSKQKLKCLVRARERCAMIQNAGLRKLNLAVKLWSQNSFGKIVMNLQAHQILDTWPPFPPLALWSVFQADQLHRWLQGNNCQGLWRQTTWHHPKQLQDSRPPSFRSKQTPVLR